MNTLEEEHMIDFGKYAILDNAKHYFEDEPEIYWEFRPSTSTDELAMARFYADNSEELGEAVNLKIVGPHWIKVMWRELAMLYGGTNLKDEEGNPVLKENPKIDEIESILKQMPQKMIVELWIALGEAVPGWGPTIPAEENPPEESLKE